MNYRTEQEHFWAGEFGDRYIDRNEANSYVPHGLDLFAKVLQGAPEAKSALELGCNVGLNLRAMKLLQPNLALAGVEINEQAAAKARAYGIADIIQGTIVDRLSLQRTYDLTFTKGVLIHIDPDALEAVYNNLYLLSNRYIMICEYYNPTPVMVTYRGHCNRLFKRDFAGELIDKFSLKLIDYGFCYHRDNRFPLDDETWFLLEKRL